MKIIKSISIAFILSVLFSVSLFPEKKLTNLFPTLSWQIQKMYPGENPDKYIALLNDYINIDDPEFIKGMSMILLEDIYKPDMDSEEKQITLDGKENDWADIPWAVTDPEGDAKKPDADITGVKYKTDTDQNLYIMIKTKAPVLPTSQGDHLFIFWVSSREIFNGTFRLQICQGKTPGDGSGIVKCYYAKTLPDGKWLPYSYPAKFGEITEAKIPLGKFMKTLSFKCPSKIDIKLEYRLSGGGGDTASSAEVHFQYPNYALSLLLNLLSRGIYHKGDSITLAMTLANNNIYSIAENDVKEEIINDIKKHIEFYDEIAEWQKELPLKFNLAKLPVTAKYYWANRAVFVPHGNSLSMEEYKTYVDKIETLRTFRDTALKNKLYEAEDFDGIISNVVNFVNNTNIYSGPDNSKEYDVLGNKNQFCTLFWLNGQLDLYLKYGHTYGVCVVITIVQVGYFRALGIPALSFGRGGSPDIQAHSFTVAYNSQLGLWETMDFMKTWDTDIVIKPFFYRQIWHHMLSDIPTLIDDTRTKKYFFLINHGFSEEHMEAMTLARDNSSHPMYDKKYIDENWVTSPDGIPSDIKKNLGLDPNAGDTDKDGFLDRWELEHGYNPLSDNSPGREIPVKNMKIVSCDSEEINAEQGNASRAIDGDIKTLWHTEWKNKAPKPPHEIIIDLGKEYNVCGFSLLPRQELNTNGDVKDYEFYVSNDPKVFDKPINKGQFNKSKSKKIILINSVKGRFVKFIALSEIYDNPWTAVAEIGIFEKGQ